MMHQPKKNQVSRWVDEASLCFDRFWSLGVPVLEIEMAIVKKVLIASKKEIVWGDGHKSPRLTPAKKNKNAV